MSIFIAAVFPEKSGNFARRLFWIMVVRLFMSSGISNDHYCTWISQFILGISFRFAIFLFSISLSQFSVCHSGFGPLQGNTLLFRFRHLYIQCKFQSHFSRLESNSNRHTNVELFIHQKQKIMTTRTQRIVLSKQ